METYTSNIVESDKGWRIWWQLTSPHTLTAAFVPVLLGTALAVQYGDIDWLLFLAMLVASILIQAATNMFNEYYDYVRGLDNENSIGIGGAIVRNGVKPSTVKTLAFSPLWRFIPAWDLYLQQQQLVACCNRYSLHGGRLFLYWWTCSNCLHTLW